MQEMDNNDDEIRRRMRVYSTVDKMTKEEFYLFESDEWKEVQDRILNSFFKEDYAKWNGFNARTNREAFLPEIKTMYCYIECDTWDKGLNAPFWAWFNKLPELVNGENVYLIVQGKHGKYWLSESNPVSIGGMLKYVIDDFYMEEVDYVIVDKNLKWMISKTIPDDENIQIEFFGEGLDVDKLKEIFEAE